MLTLTVLKSIELAKYAIYVTFAELQKIKNYENCNLKKKI
jgi:hypothetical protein